RGKTRDPAGYVDERAAPVVIEFDERVETAATSQAPEGARIATRAPTAIRYRVVSRTGIAVPDAGEDTSIWSQYRGSSVFDLAALRSPRTSRDACDGPIPTILARRSRLGDEDWIRRCSPSP